MKLWRLKRLDSEDGYNERFHEVIVAAETEEDAKDIIPTTHDQSLGADSWIDGELWQFNYDRETFAYEKAEYAEWPLLRSQVSATLIGEAIEGTPRGIILAHFK